VRREIGKRHVDTSGVWRLFIAGHSPRPAGLGERSAVCEKP